uniref:Homologous recombination OB-fold protein OB-fold domain-containing protein n=1 Tax=Cajanus cajan TaxID=3821 RepID=A0A151RYE6_CAJCA|nr:hypothetical protein KK1_030819 [Cajanus cajan]
MISFQVPMLNKNNYNNWSIKKVIFGAQDVWFLSDLNGPAMLVFNSNPWRYAIHYVKSRGLPEVTTLININHNLERVPTVVAFVEYMTPTGQGNYTINLKDPTATIGASLHYKVKQHQQYGEDIVVGCVLILKQVKFVV